MTTTKTSRRSQGKAGVRPWIVIRMALACRDKTMADVARALGVTKTAVTEVAHGRKRSARVEKALADVCCTPVQELFG